MYICVYVCTSKLAVWLSRTAIPIYSMVNPLCLQVRDLSVYPGFICLLCCFRHLYTTTRPFAHVNFSDHGSNPCPEFCQSSSPSTPHPVSGGIPPLLSTHPVTTPLRADTWAQALLSHSDRLGVDSLIQGIHGGFRIGLQLQPSCRYSHNMPSASQQEAMVDDFLRQQCTARFMLGPFPTQECSGIVTSSMGVIPKKTPGKWLAIVDLSRPKGASVNDNTRHQHCHLANSSVYDATLLMQALGPEVCMAKMDICDAYRLVPIHSADHPFLGVSWCDRVFVDCQVPFGLVSVRHILCDCRSSSGF